VFLGCPVSLVECFLQFDGISGPQVCLIALAGLWNALLLLVVWSNLLHFVAELLTATAAALG